MAFPPSLRVVKPGAIVAQARAMALGRSADWLQILGLCSMALFYAMAAACSVLFLSIFVLPRRWIPFALIGIWVCIGVAAVALLVVHVLPDSAMRNAPSAR